jgi:hypothetical protein
MLRELVEEKKAANMKFLKRLQTVSIEQLECGSYPMDTKGKSPVKIPSPVVVKKSPPGVTPVYNDPEMNELLDRLTNIRAQLDYQTYKIRKGLKIRNFQDKMKIDERPGLMILRSYPQPVLFLGLGLFYQRFEKGGGWMAGPVGNMPTLPPSDAKAQITALKKSVKELEKYVSSRKEYFMDILYKKIESIDLRLKKTPEVNWKKFSPKLKYGYVGKILSIQGPSVGGIHYNEYTKGLVIFNPTGIQTNSYVYGDSKVGKWLPLDLHPLNIVRYYQEASIAVDMLSEYLSREGQ